MDGLAGKARDRANVGGTWARRRDTLSKLRTVRNIERVSVYILTAICYVYKIMLWKLTSIHVFAYRRPEILFPDFQDNGTVGLFCFSIDLVLNAFF